MRSAEVMELYDKVSSDYNTWLRFLKILSHKQISQAGSTTTEEMEKTLEEVRREKKEVVRKHNNISIDDFEYITWLRNEKKRINRKIFNFANKVANAIRYAMKLKRPSNPTPRPQTVASSSILFEGDAVDDYLSRSGRLSIHTLNTSQLVSDEGAVVVHESKPKVVDEPMPPVKPVESDPLDFCQFQLPDIGDEELLEDVCSPTSAVLISPSKLSKENQRIQQEEKDWQDFELYALQPEYRLKQVQDCAKEFLNLKMNSPGTCPKLLHNWSQLVDQNVPKKFTDDARQVQYSSEWIQVFVEVVKIGADLFLIDGENGAKPNYSFDASQSKEDQFISLCISRMCGSTPSERIVSMDHDYDTNESRRMAERLVVEGMYENESRLHPPPKLT